MSGIVGAITSAVSRGFTARTILQYISRNYPQYASAIANASAIGFTADKILKHLVDSKGKNPENSDQFLTDSEKTDRNDRNNKRRAAIGLGAGALGLAGLASLGLRNTPNTPINPQGLLPNSPTQPVLPPPSPVSPVNPPVPGAPINPPPVVPQSPGQMATPATPMPQGMTPGQQIQQNVQATLNSALNPVGGEQIAQASQAIPDQPMQTPVPLFEQLMDGIDIESLDEGTQQQLRFLSMISDQLESQGKTLEDVQFKNLKKKIDKLLQGKGGILLEEASRRLPKPEPTSPIEKSSIVSTPVGVGEIKSISGDNAIIDVDGKAHKVNTSEIEPSVFTDDDVANAYDHIMKVIPEAHRSGFIQWAGYDEDRNVLGFIPRGGKYEELHNITPEEAKLIKEGKGVARTSGENKEGIWVTGEDTRGGVISQIIWDRKKKEDSLFAEATGVPKQKAKRSTEKDTKGMQPVFDEMGYAREKSREREKANKLAEKLRKQKEKDEAKKRKKQA